MYLKRTSMFDYFHLQEVLTQIKRSGKKAIFCYRNSGDLKYSSGKLNFKGVELPWEKEWYFDKSQAKFDLLYHYAQYKEAVVVVLDNQTGESSSVFTKINLNNELTSSVWCSLEMCLATTLYIIDRKTWYKTTPSAIKDKKTTNIVYHKVYDAVSLWKSRDGKHNNETSIKVYNLIKDAVNCSNNKDMTDVGSICKAIYHHCK